MDYAKFVFQFVYVAKINESMVDSAVGFVFVVDSKVLLPNSMYQVNSSFVVNNSVVGLHLEDQSSFRGYYSELGIKDSS